MGITVVRSPLEEEELWCRKWMEPNRGCAVRGSKLAKQGMRGALGGAMRKVRGACGAQ